MKRSRTCSIGLSLAIIPILPGCDDLILTNVIAGLQEGTITTATGIIDTFFEEQFPVDASADGEEGGDDLFVRL